MDLYDPINIIPHTVLNIIHIAEKIPNHQLSFIWCHNLVENILFSQQNMEYLKCKFLYLLSDWRLYFDKSGKEKISWIWRWCIDYGKKVIRNLFFCTTWNDRWRQLSLSLQLLLVYTNIQQRLFFSKEFQIPAMQVLQERFMPSCYKRHFSWNIAR